jgi:DNA-binding response OmpR family regulator
MSIVTIVNDSPEFLELIREVLEAGDHEVRTLAGEASVESLVRTGPDLLIIDIRAGGPDELAGWGLVVEARKRAQLHRVPVIICTGDMRFVREHDAEIAALDATVLAKPFRIEDLEAAVTAALETAPAEPQLPPQEGTSPS